MSLLRSLRLALFAAFLLPISTAAQNYVATQPDNTLTPAGAIGVPPEPSKAGTHEAVSNTSGGLSFFLPVLSLPQRGGWNLTLGYYNTSPHWYVVQDVSVQITEPSGGLQNGGPAATLLNYTNNITGYLDPPFRINLPTLQASAEYTGDVQLYDSGNLNNPAYEIPVVCLTNWVFTDWSGNKHPFTNVAICNVSPHSAWYNNGGKAATLAQVTDSTDGSWLRLNTTYYDSSQYTTGITVTTKDGTVYTFPGFPASSWGPICGATTSCPESASTDNWGNGHTSPWYNETFSSMVDNTGTNTVTLNGSTLTDTIGRSISVTNAGITYDDSSGAPQTITVAATTQSQQQYSLGYFSCSAERIPPNTTIHTSAGNDSFTYPPSTATITLPVVNGTSRTYTLQFDGLGNLIQASYPEGGYTKYVYQTEGYYQVQGLVGCGQPEHEVAQKRECPLSSGACSSQQELVTTYTPTPDPSAPFNDNVAVQDPLGDVTQVINQNLIPGFVAPHEVTRYIYPPSQYTPCGTPPCGNPIRTIQTAYTPYLQGTDIQIPSQITTTLNDGSPAVSTVTKYQYEQVQMSYCLSGAVDSAQVDIDNPTETDEYDYATSGTGTELKETAQTWKTGGIYDIAQGHLLDRLATRTVTDPSTNNQETLSYGYNSVGDITSKTVGGTGVTSLTTSYQRDPYGNITQMTDPKNNVTNFGYTNDWANSGCTTSASSAYLTSITDALSHVTKFSYYPCTGLKESTTDPNNQATTYTYDALGRPLNITRPDSGQTNDSYGDTAPNTVTESSSITSTLNKTSVTTLDGFGRTIETQLTSDPDGTDEVDTTYDSLGRVASVSNPYRTTSDSTYGITYYSYDALDRTTQVEQPDGINSKITTSYSGNFTTVTDEAGKERKSENDALGRLTNVWEDPSGLNYLTTYSYL